MSAREDFLASTVPKQLVVEAAHSVIAHFGKFEGAREFEGWELTQLVASVIVTDRLWHAHIARQAGTVTVPGGGYLDGATPEEAAQATAEGISKAISDMILDGLPWPDGSPWAEISNPRSI